MRKLLGVFVIALLAGCAVQERVIVAGHKNTVISGHGELYVIYNSDQSVRVVAERANGNVLDTTMVRMPQNLILHYFSKDETANYDFEFTLHDPIKHSWRQQQPEKTLVVSDLHGNLEAFIAVLKGNGVVDDNLHWRYGANQLIFLGDILDRGRNDNGIAWLVYKLEKEAEDAGGRVDFLLGNHEDMVLKNDIRYVNKEHLDFAAEAGVPYAELYGRNTELGKWIRDSYMVLLVGDDLFVHAGLSAELIERNYTLGEINELAGRFVGYPTKEKNGMHPRNEFLFGTIGTLWYRGLAYDAEKYFPITSDNLDKVMQYYRIKHIVVGHSEVDEVNSRYGDRVVTVNVRHYDNYPADRSAALLIEKDKLYSVTYSGKKLPLIE